MHIIIVCADVYIANFFSLFMYMKPSATMFGSEAALVSL